MRKPYKRVLLPALTAMSLAVTGCSASGSSPAKAEEPASSPSSAASEAPQEMAVAAAPMGVAAAPADGSAAPSAVARPSSAAPRRQQPHKSALRVASYDRKSGTAVLTAARTKKPGAASSSPGAAPAKSVAVGDVFASAPAPGAPNGVLAKVTKVEGTTAKGTRVRTEPATLPALLGDARAGGKVAVDPSAVKVRPLVPGVKVSWAKRGNLNFGPKGAKLPLGSLRVDVGTSIATAKGAPASAKASVNGFVQLAPEVDFAYDGRGTDGRAPGTASLALAGDWKAAWELKGRAAASTENGKPLRLPFAKLHATPVIQVGPVPVVVNADLTCYLQVDGDGKITVDVKQDVKGDFKVGGSYSRAKGWAPVSRAALKGSPVKASASAGGKVKAALGAEAAVGLYGTVGVVGDLSPYLRAEGVVRGDVSSDGKKSVKGKWAAFGGVDLNGALQLQLKIFGTPVFERRVALPGLHREWKLAGSRA
ncbi:hypothetical protein I5Q34_13935 [Streptomyces sp. AV19]|uniref:hypothetical protein n=1 Tax=Streptomyces sp. AV19 TaxID=2793068 RepID=UPI0018FE0F84|nr:hypothetical protein [Streptomyces sp. AV19]MBH1935359.1 hypothetical protein [Streptomyces sp. AV19]MDG4531245.1 hypothetical protein [Streptomyces sp. AV19]